MVLCVLALRDHAEHVRHLELLANVLYLVDVGGPVLDDQLGAAEFGQTLQQLHGDLQRDHLPKE